GGDEPVPLPDRLAKQLEAGVLTVGRETVRRHGLDAERPKHERQDERRSGVAVVDDEPEVARADYIPVDPFQQILRVGLADARRIVDAAHGAERDAPELSAREVPLHL